MRSSLQRCSSLEYHASIPRLNTTLLLACFAAQGQAVPGSDVWSFGLLLVFMTTRSVPYPGLHTPQQVVAAVLSNSMAPACPDEVYPPLK